jgi:co-chaperonin GroES (HSP10)
MSEAAMSFESGDKFFAAANETWADAAHKLNTSGIVPTEFKVLIRPKEVEEKSAGGIIIPDMKKDAEKYATIEGTIVAISHLAFTYATAEEWGDQKPRAGQRVIFAKYAGVRTKGPRDGVEYLLVNDKDVVATVED